MVQISPEFKKMQNQKKKKKKEVNQPNYFRD